MRPFMIPSLLLVVAACAEESDPTPLEGDYTVTVIGTFEPKNPDDPLSAWVGVEKMWVENHQGTLVCESTLDANGATVADDDSELTLEMLRAEIRELGESCDIVYEEVQESLTAGARFLSFDAHEGRFGEERGLVSTSSDLEGWDGYAPGIRDGASLTYRRSWSISQPDDRPDVPTDWEHKPLQELPIY